MHFQPIADSFFISLDAEESLKSTPPLETAAWYGIVRSSEVKTQSEIVRRKFRIFGVRNENGNFLYFGFVVIILDLLEFPSIFIREFSFGFSPLFNLFI